jgi:hypothetical protein
MSIKWGEALSKGLRFGIDPKRWLPFFILDTCFFGVLIMLALSNLEMLASAMTVMSTSPSAFIPVLGIGAVFIFVFIVWNVLKLWVTGAVIHQSVKEKEIVKSFRYCCSRYLHLIVVTIVAALLSSLLGMIPFIGPILSIIIGLVFFFAMQEVIVGKKDFMKAIEGSWKMFQRRPVRVFVMWLVVAAIGGIIVLIFALPLLVMALSTLLPYLVQAEEAVAMAAMIAYMLGNLTTLIVLGAITLVGSSISTTFVIKATTEYYVQSRKKP